MSTRISRRGFLGRSVAAGGLAAAGPIIVPSWARGAAPSDKLNVAVIGVAGRGAANLGGVAKENVVALCDVDEINLTRTAAKFPSAKTFRDFRKMLEAVEKQIEAVVVSTPDHTHAPAAAMAMRMGKHCYSEKPMTRTVFECRTLADLARDKKLATQLGTQIHAGTNYRRVVELVQGGAVGAVREVHVWSSASYGGMDRPKDTPSCPPNLDWDLWLGPSRERPYHPCYVPGKWRAWWDFGSGGLGDFGCHYMDLPFWALKLRYPTSVEAEGPPVHPETTPRSLTVCYEFPARGTLPAVKMTWYDGGKRPTALLSQAALVGAKTKHSNTDPAKWTSGVLFVGEKGMLLADYNRRMLLPESKYAGFTPPAETIPNTVGHHQEWINACKGQAMPGLAAGETTCKFDYSGPLTETVLLGCVSFRAGSKLAWDAAALKATNCPKAEEFVKQPYREGWKL